MYKWTGITVSVLYAGKDIIEEPDAVIPHVRICVGASQQWGVYHDQGNTMKPHHYLAILVRLFAIALFVVAIKQSYSLFYLVLGVNPQGFYGSIWQIVVNFFMPFCMSLTLWFFPVIVAKSILKPEIDQTIEPLNKQCIFSVLVASLGLYVCLYAIVDATYYFTLWQFAASADNYGNVSNLFNEDTKANIWATGVELILGLTLILKSKTIAQKLFSIAR